MKTLTSFVILLCISGGIEAFTLKHSPPIIRQAPTYVKAPPTISTLSRTRVRNYVKVHRLSMSSSDVASPDTSGSEADTGGESSMASSSFNLVKACIGAGVLAFPGGVAAFADVPRALVPASLIMAVLGFVSGYSFYSIGRTCKDEGASSIGEAWTKTVGKDSSWLVDVSLFLTTVGAALSFSINLGDLVSSVLQTLGVTGFMAGRHASILGVTLSSLLPLCSLSSLAALAPVSIVGVFSSILTCLFLGYRTIDGSYNAAKSGHLLTNLAATKKPQFGIRGNNFFSPSILILFSMIATGYMSHFAASDIQKGLKNNTNERFRTLCIIGFGITTVLSILFMSFGFLTFGGASGALVLNNYANEDVGAILCRSLTAISLLGSFPIVFNGARSTWLSLTNKGKEVSSALRTKTTRILLSIITGVALILEDSGFVVSVNGALTGSAIIYIFPAIMFLKSTNAKIKSGALTASRSLKIERIFNKLMIGLGVLLGGLGAAVSVITQFFPGVL